MVQVVLIVKHFVHHKILVRVIMGVVLFVIILVEVVVDPQPPLHATSVQPTFIQVPQQAYDPSAT